MSDTAEIGGAVGCVRKDYAERVTGRGHSKRARLLWGLNGRMVESDDRRSW